MNFELPPGIKVFSPETVEIGDILNEGGFGKVYYGRVNFINVALKRLDFDSIQKKIGLSEQQVNRLLYSEIVHMASLSHPNLITFYGVVIKEDQVYLVMEYCQGETLWDVLQSNDALKHRNLLPWFQRLQWALEITQAVVYLHQRGVIHGDLKTTNILLDGYDKTSYLHLNSIGNYLLYDKQRVVIIDLALACDDLLLQENKNGMKEEITSSKNFPPEALYTLEKNNKRQYFKTTASDIYALGWILWELVTDEKIDKEESLKDCLNKPKLIKEGKFKLIPEDCREGFKELILDCWRAKPQDRPTAFELSRKIETLAYSYCPFPLIRVFEINDGIVQLTPQLSLNQFCIYMTADRVTDTDQFWCQQQGEENRKPCDSQLVGNIKIALMVLQNADKRITRHPQVMFNILPTTLQVFFYFLHADQKKILVVMGESGAGKTMMIYRGVKKLMDQWRTYFFHDQLKYYPLCLPPPFYLPIFIRQGLSRWSHKELTDAINKVLSSTLYNMSGEQLSEIAKKQEMYEIRLLVILDSYEKLQVDQTPQNLFQQLGLEKWPGSKLVVACHPNSVETSQFQTIFGNQDEVMRHYLLPLNLHEMHSCLNKLCLSNEVCKTFRERVETQPHLRRALRNPRMFSLFIENIVTFLKEPFYQFNSWKFCQVIVSHWLSFQQHLLPNYLQLILIAPYYTLLESFSAFAVQRAFKNFVDIKLPFSYWAKLQYQVESISKNDYVHSRKNHTMHSKDYYAAKMILNEKQYTHVMLQRLIEFNSKAPLDLLSGNFEFRHQLFLEYFLVLGIVQWILAEDCMSLLNSFAIEAEPNLLHLLQEAWQDSQIFSCLKENLKQLLLRVQNDPTKKQAEKNAEIILNKIRIAEGDSQLNDKIDKDALSLSVSYCSIFHDDADESNNSNNSDADAANNFVK